MRITFIDRLFAKTTNEGGAVTVVAKFWDDSTETWTTSTPTTVKYRLDNADGTQVTDWTTVTPASSVTISLTGTQNAITSDCRDYETKQLTVKADDGLSTQYSDVFVFRVRNIVGML